MNYFGQVLLWRLLNKLQWYSNDEISDKNNVDNENQSVKQPKQPPEKQTLQ